MFDNCMYSDLADITSYKKGCRCPRCVDAMKYYAKKYNNSVKGKQNTKNQRKSEKRKKYMLVWAETNKEKMKEYRKKYAHSLKGMIISREKCAKRRAKQKCPLSLGDKEQIKLIYEECYRITQETGIPHHVDHIIPLALGGLHHPSNLQILTAEENLKKGCKLLQ